MCTAFSINKYKHYFARSLDLEYNYNEQIIIIPRNYNLQYKYNKSNNNHFSFFGIGIIENNYPLLYDGCNEKGLCIAGLNLPKSTIYNSYSTDKINICSFEIIPYILSNCINCNDTKQLLNKINITNDCFNNYYNTAKLHFLISDGKSSFVLEIINKKIIILDNPYNVLTNEPNFSFHLDNIKYYEIINNQVIDNKGSQMLGMPGDNLSKSRFIRAYYASKYFIFNENNISELFNIFNIVFEINGLSKISKNNYYKTIYISIYNSIDKICYIKSYNCSNIIKINLFDFNIDSTSLTSYTIYHKEKLIELK